MKSVCIATYNGSKFIEEQIRSILSQLEKEDEILVSDDGSIDNTIEIINKIEDPRIKILPSPLTSNIQGLYKEFQVIHRVSNNFLNAIRYAKGDTIYLSDQDDVWKDCKVNVCEDALRKYELVIHRRTDVDYKLVPLGYKLPKDNRVATFFQTLKVSHFQGACMCFTKQIKELIITNIDIFNKVYLSHDHAIGYLVMANLGKSVIYFEPRSLLLYRRHGNNVSSTGEKSHHSLLFKILYRVNDCRIYLKFILRKRSKNS